MVDAVLDLLTNSFDEAIWTVAGFGEFGGESVPGSSGEEVAAGENARTDRLPGIEGMLHPNIDEVRHPCRADAHHASLQQTLPGIEPILHNLFGQSECGRRGHSRCTCTSQRPGSR